jgi:hypothetical protein
MEMDRVLACLAKSGNIEALQVISTHGNVKAVFQVDSNLLTNENMVMIQISMIYRIE